MRLAAQTEMPRGSTRRRAQTLSRMRVEEMLAGYAFVLPAFLGLAVFMLLPILASFGMVFTRYDLLTPPEWVAFENIRRLFTDRRMLTCYWNIVRVVVAATTFNNLLGFLLAVGVNRAMPSVLRYVLRTAFFLPVLTTTATLAAVWQFLLTLDRGVANYLLQQIGLAPVPWLSSTRWAIISVIIFDVWKSCGYLMVLYLAGLQGIPQILYEAAKIDGASRWQLLRHITLPLITPTAFFCIVISCIGAFQIFDNAFVLTGGGPGDASRTIAMYIYEVAFRRYEMGYASAVSLSLLAILVVLTLIQFRLSRRWVHYD